MTKERFRTLFLLSMFTGFLTFPSGMDAQFDSARFNKNNEQLKILNITPAGVDVRPKRQIVFNFNRPVVPVGRMERRPDEIPIAIEPALQCEWRWLNTSALACQLGEKTALAPATRYTVVVRPGIKTEDGSTLKKTITHTFVTERPKIRYSSFKTWTSPGTPHIIVQFNMPVERASVARHLYLDADGARLPLDVMEDPDVRKARERGEGMKEKVERYAGMVVEGVRALLFSGRGRTDKERLDYVNRSWLITPKKELPLDATIRLLVEPGIISAAGPEPGVEERVVVAFNTFPPFHFIGIRCMNNNDVTLTITQQDNPEDYRCSPLRQVSLVFSSPVAKGPVQKHVLVTPDLAGGRTDYDPWENVNVYSRLSQPHRKGREYTVPLPYGLKAYDTYHLSARAKRVRDMFDRPLPADLDVAFATDHRLPDFDFLHPVSVLESNVDTHLPVVVTNLDSIRLDYETQTVHKRRVPRKKTIRVPEAEDVAYYFPLKIRDLIPGRSGAMQGRWRTKPKTSSYYWGDLPNWFFSQVTPFNAHVKLGHYNTLIWVTRFDTGKPVAGAKVQLYTERFGAFQESPEILAHAVTDKNGTAMLPGTATLDPNLRVMGNYRRSDPHFFVRVSKGGDLALVPLVRDYEIALYGASETYVPSYLQRRYGHIHTWGFTAQGVYKAGDTIQYKLFVRDQDNKRFVPAPRKGYTLTVVDPRGKVVHEIKDFTLSTFGSHEGEFTVPKSGAVGWYVFRLRAAFTHASWEPIRVLISDFTPAPFRVSSDLNGRLFKTGDTVAVTTQASLHAGGPYGNAQTRVTATVDGMPLVPADHVAKGFFYDVYRHDAGSTTVHQSEASVNSQGILETKFTMPEAKVLFGQLTIESAVRDDRGKYIAGRASGRYVGRDRFVGLRQKDWLLKSGRPAKLQTMVINEQGRAVAGTNIKITIDYRETTASKVKGAGNAYLTQYTHTWKSFDDCKVISGTTARVCTFTPKKAGYYRMTAEIQDTKGRIHRTHMTRWAIGAGRVLWATTPGNGLQIIPEKTEYTVGDTARYLVQNPYPGAQALITIERFGTQKRWVRMFSTSTEIVEVPITADSLPGFYLSVIVMSPRVDKPLGENQVDLGKPAFRIGYVRVPVKDPAKELRITATPQKKTYKPRDTVTVGLQAHTRKPVELAVAVLDESVFDLIKTGRNYFDPYKGFYHLDALDLKNFSLLTRLVGRQKFEKKGANTGGGGAPEQDLALRSIFKFVSYWNPRVKLDTSGKGTIRFQAPDNLTGWRILAIGVTPADRMGLGDANFKVNQDTEIRPALPNQVTAGDRFEARFTVMNRTDRTRTLQVAIEGTGSVQAKTGRIVKRDQITAEPFKRYTLGIPVTAGRKGDIVFTVRAGDQRDRDSMQVSLPVRMQKALEAAATYGTSTSRKVTERVQFPNNIRTDVGRISVVASPTVIGGLEGAFKYVRDYPYVCWEQKLTKGVMASHYLNLKAYLPDSLVWNEASVLPKRTLQRAANYQAPNGGMVYYIPVNRYADPYLSAYTAIAFNWLRAGGYAVPGQVEHNLHGYLLKLLRRDVMPDFYSRGMSSTVRAVALAALAEHGKISLRDLKRYRRHVPEMSLFGKAHYLMALTRVAGTDEIEREVIDMIRSHANQTGGKFVFSESLDFAYKRILDSSLRTNCAVLSAYLAHEDPKRNRFNASDVPFKLVRTITQGRKQKDRWENTQENMFCMNALIDYSRLYEKTKPDMSLQVSVDAQNLGTVRFQNHRNEPKDFERPIMPGDPGRTATVKLERSGKGRYYYATRLFYSPKVLKPDPINSGIEVHREYSVERKGKWKLLKSPVKITTGELVRVDLYVSLPAARNFVVVDDPVPGGLEPVNRDLATASEVDAKKGDFRHAGGSFWYRFSDWRTYGWSSWSFYHKELRHHAARFYSEYLPAGRYHLSYVAQAIAPGEFTVMPVHAEEMYDPDVFGQGVPAILDVELSK